MLMSNLNENTNFYFNNSNSSSNNNSNNNNNNNNSNNNNINKHNNNDYIEINNNNKPIVATISNFFHHHQQQQQQELNETQISVETVTPTIFKPPPIAPPLPTPLLNQISYNTINNNNNNNDSSSLVNTQSLFCQINTLINKRHLQQKLKNYNNHNYNYTTISANTNYSMMNSLLNDKEHIIYNKTTKIYDNTEFSPHKFNNNTSANSNTTTDKYGVSYTLYNQLPKVVKYDSTKEAQKRSKHNNSKSPSSKPNTNTINANSYDIRRFDYNNLLQIDDENQFDHQLIVSKQGTIRGSLNHVKLSLKQIFKENQNNITALQQHVNENKSMQYLFLSRNFEEEEIDKIVIYTTTLQIVRKSYADCKLVKKILQSHCVRYEERDLYKNKEYQRELKFRLNLAQINVPHVFFNGRHIANCEQLELLSDQGLLNKLFKNLEKIKLRIYCYKCGGYRFVLCTLCNGSKKIFNNFTNLKCTTCNEDGLLRCDSCLDQQE